MEPDPADVMLAQARGHEPGVEWVLEDLRARKWHGEFELTVMTGHAFQVLLGEEELCLVLRAGEIWTPDRMREISDGRGGVVHMGHEVESVSPADDRVTFTETETEPLTVPCGNGRRSTGPPCDSSARRGSLLSSGTATGDEGC
ncbi:hypothetical protein [Streptomyces sp. NBC_00343]|uniref:hypothetical protein n=1 Tax=Streptomyces sp. NBC_00343 TaxID=2975719 RepID=UPI002E2B529A|nr:hypothetical protein [Streptomyces sp. NBC_00343]